MANYHLTKKQLVLDYKFLRSTFKRQPSCTDFERHCYDLSTVTRVFGADGWRKMVRASGDKPLRKKIIFNLTAKQLADDFLNLQKKLGRPPKLSEYAAQCHTAKLLDKKFGRPGWKNMLKKLGVKVKRNEIDEKKQLIIDYLSLRKEMKSDPTIDQFFKRRHHTYKFLSRVFVKRPWNSFLAAVRNYEVRNKTVML